MKRVKLLRAGWLLAMPLLLGLAIIAVGHSLGQQAKNNQSKVNGQARTNGQPTIEHPLSEWVKTLKWRSIGPAVMAGRITALAVYEKDPTLFYVATASGGLLKTVNNGISFEHQFDDQPTVSIGDVAVSQTDPNIVWVGTGENNPRNSVSYGDGVYKSTDGGKTWQNMGLKESFQIGKIIIHPTNPDIVYVGALGRLYGPNRERGLFKTTDGGKTWEKILYVDDKTGVIDMRMHPNDPNTLLVATYERKRDGFDGNDPAVKWGKGSGLYKTTDGGKTFKQITAGLPEGMLGRIGLDWYRKDPNVVYMVLESEHIGKAGKDSKVKDGFMGIFGDDVPNKKGAVLTRIVDDGPAAKAGIKPNDIVVEFNKTEVKDYDNLLELISKHSSGEKVPVKLNREGKDVSVEVTLGKRPEEQGGGGRPHMDRLGGQKENIQDQQGEDGYKYGGIYRSEDGGETWKRVNSLNPRPMYFSQVRVDPSDDKYVYVLGIQLYRSVNGGKRFTPDAGRGTHADHHAMWINPKDGRHMILGNDGGAYMTYDRTKNWDHLNHAAIGQFYHVAIDTRPDYKVYGGLQDNGTWGGPAFIKGASGQVNADWFRVGGGDGFRCAVDPNDPDLVYYTSQNGALQRRNFRTGETKSIRPNAQGKRLRWNWNTPFNLSHHNSNIYYCVANYVFRALDRGEKSQIISPEITLTNEGTGTAFSESPRNPNVLYVGTDDGALWVTRDGGAKWTNITKNLTSLPEVGGPRWVASIEASRFADGRAYVALDGHRSDDDNPHVYVTEDYGQTFKSLRGNLPWGSTRVLREDLKNQNVLYLGTEFGAWASVDRGQSWVSLNTNLPTVAVHEFAQHPTTGEMVAATHGRSFWVLEVTPLRQMTPDVFSKSPKLYEPAPVVRWVSAPAAGRTNREFVADRRPTGAQIYYSLPADAKNVSLRIVDIEGKTIQELRPSKTAGLHLVSWNLSRQLATPAAGGGRGGRGGRGAGGGGQRGGGFGGFGGGGNLVERLNAMDANKDKKISKDEVPEQMQQFIFERMDTNKDGVIDQKELAAAPQAGGGRRGGQGGGRPEIAGGGQFGRGGQGGGGPGGLLDRLKEMDANKDNKIAKTEVPEEMQQFFERMDDNGDGFIDQKEMAQITQQFGQAGRGGGRGGRGGRGGGMAPPGAYRIVLTVDGVEQSQVVRVIADPSLPPTILAAEEDQTESDEIDEEEDERIDWR